MDKRYFSDKIVKWYQNNKRNLPWRQTRNPYKIWLSEIILQQTRVNQGMPFYKRFIKEYPTVYALAAAREQEVLRLWQGLGYYSRARNLHKCAQSVVNDYDGKFPQRCDKLMGLPGIGEYTAAAIASIAFSIPSAVVDGNVFRVLSRVFGVDTIINSPQGKKEFTLLANELMCFAAEPSLHNQAMMEFGALNCTPKNPKCESCIFQKNCVAFHRNLQEHLPLKAKPKPSRKRYFYYIVMEHENSLLMRKRDQKDIWIGLFDFHLIEKNKPVKPEKILTEDVVKKIARSATEISISKSYKHILTHQTIFSRFIIIKTDQRIDPMQKNQCFYSFPQIARLPKPVLVSRFLSEHYLL